MFKMYFGWTWHYLSLFYGCYHNLITYISIFKYGLFEDTIIYILKWALHIVSLNCMQEGNTTPCHKEENEGSKIWKHLINVTQLVGFKFGSIWLKIHLFFLQRLNGDFRSYESQVVEWYLGADRVPSKLSGKNW